MNLSRPVSLPHGLAAARPLRIVAVARHRLGRVLARLVPEVAAQAQIELVAHAFEDAVVAVRALHAQSDRAGQPFIAVNCAEWSADPANPRQDDHTQTDQSNCNCRK